MPLVNFCQTWLAYSYSSLVTGFTTMGWGEELVEDCRKCCKSQSRSSGAFDNVDRIILQVSPFALLLFRTGQKLMLKTSKCPKMPRFAKQQ